MKSSFRTVALAASLGLARPAIPAEPVKPKASVPPAIDALQALARELARVEDPKLPLRTTFERLEAFRPTPETADKLRAAFGTSKPFLFQRQPDQDGRPAWRATLLPLHYVSGPDAGVDWDTAILDLALDKSGTALDAAGSWNSVSASSSDMRFNARGATLSGRHRLDHGVWYGAVQMRVASVRLEPKAGTPLTLDDLRFESRTIQHPTSADLVYDSRIGAIGAAGERIEDVHFGMRIVNMDKQALAELEAASAPQHAPTASRSRCRSARRPFPLRKS